MTRYDPFSYGQVPSNKKEQSAAPDDLLFADAAPVKATPAADSDWAPPADDRGSAFQIGGGGVDAAAFGADILGEAVPPAPSARPHAGAAPAGARAAVAMAPAAARPAPKPAAAPVAQPAAAAPSRPVVRPAVMPMPPRRSSTASVLVPIAAVAGGSGTAWWLYEMQNNPVMAGIVGLIALVGAALAHVILRR